MENKVPLILSGARFDSQRAVHGRVYAFCGGCGLALVPCPAGGDDAVRHGPRYVGFYSCCRVEPIYLPGEGK